MTNQHSSIKEAKQALRQVVLNVRAQLTETERLSKSSQIQEHIMGLPEYSTAQTVMLFLNFRDEVETTQLAQHTLELGKQLVLPRCAPKGVLIPALIRDLEQDVEPGMWGIREPHKERLIAADPQAIDLVIVPGAAFDRTGNRLGYGAGYYDRFFHRLRPGIPKIAIGFACQIVPEVPVGQYDQKITGLVTEEGVYRF